MSGFVPTRGSLPKCPTGIRGLDEITMGGLPRGRPTLICGGAGCGKTLLAAEFLVRGITEFGEPGVFMVFEETAQDLIANVASLGFELDRLVAEGKLYIDYVRVERHEIEETGEYDLDGLFIRLAYAIQKVGAKRVALDTIEMLFGGLQNPLILRAELRRLLQWLKDQGVTAVVTAERAEKAMTRHGLEEYVSDCVIMLDHRVDSQVSTRRLRIVKYRGSVHGTNEYPFLIDESGFTVVPITSSSVDHPASEERVPSGIAGLDEMLGGAGFFRGATILFSGTAGTGKTTAAAYFADATCRQGERTLYFAFEESPAQIARNLRSIGLNLQPHVDAGVLRFYAARPTLRGIEAHLAQVLRAIEQFDPSAVIVDSITALLGNAATVDVRALVIRLIDALKARGTTTIFTTLTRADEGSPELTEVGISSLVDTWLLLRDMEQNGERNRGMHILKSRGMAHSNQIREFMITAKGVSLVPVYLGPEGLLTGSSRLQQEARARLQHAERAAELERKRRRLEQKRAAVTSQIATLRAELEADAEEFEATLEGEASREQRAREAEADIAQSRYIPLTPPVIG